MKIRIKKPKESFESFLKKQHRIEMFNDLAHIFGITYVALKKDSPLSLKRKEKILNKCIDKLIARQECARWTDTNRRWQRALAIELDISEKSERV